MKLLTELFDEDLLEDEPREDVLRYIESHGTLTLDDLHEEEWILQNYKMQKMQAANVMIM